MIKGASRLYINDFIRLSHLSISADLHNLLVLPPKMYRWLSQKRLKYISIIRASLAIWNIYQNQGYQGRYSSLVLVRISPLTMAMLFLIELMAQLGFYLRIV